MCARAQSTSSGAIARPRPVSGSFAPSSVGKQSWGARGQSLLVTCCPQVTTHASDLEMAAHDRGHWLALYVLCVGMLMIVLDATIVNVALPSIQEDLDFSQNDLAWVVNAYLVAFGGLLLLAGRIGDLIGQRRVFLV